MREADELLTELRQRAIQGELRASRVRSICWRVLLGVLSAGESEAWLQETRDSRKCYCELRHKLQVNPRQDKVLVDDNPLSQQAEVSFKYLIILFAEKDTFEGIFFII